MEASPKFQEEPQEDHRTVCLNLGCGNQKMADTDTERWLNLDQFANDGVQIVANLEDGLPMIDDESIDTIFASHVLEHIKNWTQLIRECHRVLKPRGVLFIKVPEGGCRAAYADPTHVNLFAPETFHHFWKDSGIGFDSLGMRHIGFNLGWCEMLRYINPTMDDGRDGGYFTEIMVDLVKTGDPYPWEEEVMEAIKKQEELEKAEALEVKPNEGFYQCGR